MFSREIEKQKAKLVAITGWVYKGKGATALFGPLKLEALTDIRDITTNSLPKKIYPALD